MSIRRVAALIVTAMPEEVQPFLDALPAVEDAEPLSLLGTARAWTLRLPDASPALLGDMPGIAASAADLPGEEAGAEASSQHVPHEIIVVCSGIGLVAGASVLATVLTQVRPDVVISAGTTGGLGADVNVGDVCVSRTLTYGDVDATAFGYAMGQTPGQPAVFEGDPQLVACAGAAQAALSQATPSSAQARLHVALMLSGGSFVTANNVTDMRKRFPDAVSTDMESTALAQVCAAAGVRFVSVRGVSDLCGPQAGQDFHIGADEASARSAAVTLCVVGGC